MNLLKEIFEPLIPAIAGILLTFFIVYASPALILSKLLMDKYPTRYDKKLKVEKLDIVISFSFSTGFWLLIYLTLINKPI